MAFLGITTYSAHTTQQIKTNIAELETAVSKINASLREYEESLAMLKDIRNTISGSWEGLAATSYKNGISNLISVTQANINVLTQVKKTAQKRIDSLKNDLAWRRKLDTVSNVVSGITKLFTRFI